MAFRYTKEEKSKAKNTIVANVAVGGTLDVSADLAGVPIRTLQDWRKKDKRFALALTRARSKAEALASSAIVRMFQKDWKAAAWFLSHRIPERWSDKRLLSNGLNDASTVESLTADYEDGLNAGP